MKTLLVAPENELQYGRREADRVVTALHPTLISGYVTLPRLMDAPDPHDVIWFVAHGDDEGIALSDGKLTLGALGSLVAAQQASLLVLNTCDSVSLAHRINQAFNIDVICTITDITDTQAYVTGVKLAQTLAQGHSIGDAYKASNPLSSVEYLHLPGEFRQSRVASQLSNGSDEKRIKDLEEQQRRYRLLWDGDTSVGLMGLSERMGNINSRLAALEQSTTKTVGILEQHGEILDTYGNNQIGRVGWFAVSGFFAVMATAGIITIWTTLF